MSCFEKIFPPVRDASRSSILGRGYDSRIATLFTATLLSQHEHILPSDFNSAGTSAIQIFFSQVQ